MNEEQGYPLRSVQELLNERYYIPNYQRGYRWGKEEVEQLLQDLLDYNLMGNEDFYCLQPLIVRYCKDNKYYEVIDGQQRLTTLQLIVHYFNQYFRGADKFDEMTIEYQTRPDSGNFLKEISLDAKGSAIEPEGGSSIDFWHISRAYEYIRAWFLAQREKGTFDDGKYQSKVLHSTKVVWYEIEEEESAINVFTRNNIGKIGLSDAELLKALLLRGAECSNDRGEDLTRERLEISAQWDEMEQQLRDSDFWAFIFGKEPQPAVCIEALFRLSLGIDDAGKRSLFRFVESQIQTGDFSLGQAWADLRNLYERYRSYYYDANSTYYHYIGYLSAVGISAKVICAEILKAKTKAELRKALEKRIRQKVEQFAYTPEEGFLLNDTEDDEAKDLYGRREGTRALLLLYNVCLYMGKGDGGRFPFALYHGTTKHKGWDLEHIDSQTENGLDNFKDQKTWLNEAKIYAKTHLTEKEIKKIEDYCKSEEKDQDKFDKLYELIRKRVEEEDDEYSDSIGNLALLDAGTNRSYKNALFVRKRDLLREKEAEGLFIPQGTRIAFMKFFPKASDGLHKWGKEDKKQHEAHIYKYIQQFISKP